MKTLNYGKKNITYTVIRRERSSLEISVYPDCSVEVIAPMKASDDAIHSRIRNRLKWIARQQQGFESFYPKPSPREYVSGESWLYQGRQYRLKVIQKKCAAKVALRRPVLAVEVPERENKNLIKTALEKWYRKRAFERLNARYKVCSKEVLSFGIDIPNMRLQKMARRWGSYSASGNILLNPELVKAPTECIDYVILHELCHVKYRAHNKQFYKLLQRVVPDWLRLKYKLEHLPL